MIIVSGIAIVKPDHRDEALKACLEVTAATKLEPGCIVYDFFTDIADPNRLHVYEEYHTDADLAGHLQQPYTQAFLGKLGPLLAAPPVVVKHVVTESTPAL